MQNEMLMVGSVIVAAAFLIIYSKRARTSLGRMLYEGSRFWRIWGSVLALLSLTLFSVGGLISAPVVNQTLTPVSSGLMLLACLGSCFRNFHLFFGVVATSWSVVQMGANPESSWQLIVALWLVVLLLGQEMPWKQNSTTIFVRIVLLGIFPLFAFSGIVITLLTMFDLNGFYRWLHQLTDVPIGPGPLMAAVAALTFAWFAVGLGIGKKALLPIVTVPTLALLSYVIPSSTAWFAVPFTLALILSVDVPDRRSTAKV